MQQYNDLLRDILANGHPCADRTGVGTTSVFGRQMRFDLSKGFPLMTTKKVSFKAILVELLWFLRGDTNIKFLHDHGVTIWDEWADKNGDLGPVYGQQWRSWSMDTALGRPRGIDQLGNVIARLKSHPYDRGHIVSAWNVADLPNMALRPCHTMFQFHVRREWRAHNGPTRDMREVNVLSCQLYQRSADMFLGVPYNIASYALLTHIIAQLCGYEVGEFIHTFGDAHIYNNHREQVDELLSRVDYPPLPELYISKGQDSIDDFRVEDFRLKGYNPLPAIKAPVAV